MRKTCVLQCSFFAEKLNIQSSLSPLGDDDTANFMLSVFAFYLEFQFLTVHYLCYFLVIALI